MLKEQLLTIKKGKGRVRLLIQPLVIVKIWFLNSASFFVLGFILSLFLIALDPAQNIKDLKSIIRISNQ